jgi:ferrous iron transport protein A
MLQQARQHNVEGQSMRSTADDSVSLIGCLPVQRGQRFSAKESVRGKVSDSPQPLPDIPIGCRVRLAANGLSGLLKQRLVDLGFTPGAPLHLVRRGPKGNLIAVSIRDTMIALRSEEARSLLVTHEKHMGE